jgi:hypothetical protein
MCYSPFPLIVLATSYGNVCCKQMDDTHVIVIPRGFDMSKMVFTGKNQSVLCVDD